MLDQLCEESILVTVDKTELSDSHSCFKYFALYHVSHYPGTN